MLTKTTHYPLNTDLSGAWTALFEQSVGAFHLTKNPGLNFRNFRMLNGTVFSTRPNRSCSIPAWAHFPPRITRENAAGLWWSGCLKCRIKLLRVEKFKKHSEFNSSLIFMRETYELFSRKSMQTGRTDPQEIPAERPVHNFPGYQILTFSFSIKNRLEPWQIILHPV